MPTDIGPQISTDSVTAAAAQVSVTAVAPLTRTERNLPPAPAQRSPQEAYLDPLLILAQTPNLPPADRAALAMVAQVVRQGLASVKVLCRYPQRLTSKGEDRLPEKDFVALPGIEPGTHLGEITAVEVSKRGHLYLRLCDDLRSNGVQAGWTSLRAEGLTGFVILSSKRRVGANAGPPAEPQHVGDDPQFWPDGAD